MKEFINLKIYNTESTNIETLRRKKVSSDNVNIMQVGTDS